MSKVSYYLFFFVIAVFYSRTLSAEYVGQRSGVSVEFSDPFYVTSLEFSQLTLQYKSCSFSLRVWLPHSLGHVNWSSFQCPFSQDLNGTYIYPGSYGFPDGQFVLNVPLPLFGSTIGGGYCVIKPLSSGIIADWK